MPPELEKSVENAREVVDKINLLSELGRHDKILDAIREIPVRTRKVIESDGILHGELLSLSGLANYHTGRYNEALRCFSLLSKMYPDGANIIFMRAKCEDYLDDLNAAEFSYKTVLRIDPIAPCAHLFLGLILESQGKHNEAVGYYHQAVELGIEDDDIEKRLRALM